MMSLTYNTGASSLEELSSSKPPNFHSPDGVMKIELTHTLPCVEEQVSFKKARAT